MPRGFPALPAVEMATAQCKFMSHSGALSIVCLDKACRCALKRSKRRNNANNVIPKNVNANNVNTNNANASNVNAIDADANARNANHASANNVNANSNNARFKLCLGIVLLKLGGALFHLETPALRNTAT